MVFCQIEWLESAIRHSELTYILFLSLHPNDEKNRGLDDDRQVE